MNRQETVARAIASAMLAGPCDVAGFVASAAWVLGRRHRWLLPMCRRAFLTFGSALEARDHPRLVEWIRRDPGFRAAWLAARRPRIVRYLLESPRMAPRRGALAACDLPALSTPADLAAWLGIDPGRLDWFADLQELNGAAGPLCHYSYVWVPKSWGRRLMEVPKLRLRAIQRRILREILDPVPVHRAAHGFRRGKSCRTYAEPHVGRKVVVRLDLRDFFPCIPVQRVHALFETLGYPHAVARLLAALCTNAVPMSVARRGAASWIDAKRLGLRHLPQGAPTSPALANLCALHLDLRLDEFAEAVEGTYTRYADDLAISGGEQMRRSAARVVALVARIAIEEGFELNHRKTRVMHASDRQSLTGIVVNEKVNVTRAEFDRLKAVLTNCVRHGPASQNRDGRADYRAHLAGRVAHVRSLNPARGDKLDAIYRRIDWTGLPSAVSARAGTRSPPSPQA